MRLFQTITLFTPKTSGTASFTFFGEDFRSYAFYSVATDVAGNVEPTPSAAKASTVIDRSANTSVPEPSTLAMSSILFGLVWSYKGRKRTTRK
jgi:hypothetical protein